jgi:hypothetical protein
MKTKSLKIIDGTSAWNDVREPSVCLPLACRQETLLGISITTNDNMLTEEQITANKERRGPTQFRQTS